MGKIPDTTCSITRSLGVLGERWTLLVLRNALLGQTRFAEFRKSLGIAPDVLTDRLNTLVDYGVMERVPYRDSGARTRREYRLTHAGRELLVVVGALQQWGDRHLPPEGGPSMLRRQAQTEMPLHVGFIDQRGQQVPLSQVAMVPTENFSL